MNINVRRLFTSLALVGLLLFSQCHNKEESNQPLVLSPATDSMQILYNKISQEFDKLRPQVIMPADGYLEYPYLIPAGYYKQMWDWDGFFIGNHLMSIDQDNGKYLKYWSLNFLNSIDSTGYIAGCITTDGPRPIFGRFAMKPFLSQGVYFASESLGSYDWIKPYYSSLKMALVFREKTQKDKDTGLFFWDIAMQSGADNNPALNYYQDDTRKFLACDINTWQYREYLAMAVIAKELGEADDEIYYVARANTLKNQIANYLWNDEDESFYNLEQGTLTPVKRVSYSNFVPLIEDFVSREKGREMIKRYLWNEDHMLASYGLRSLSKQDTLYNNKNIIVPFSNWQGPVWPIANYIYSVGLVNYGFVEEAKELAGQIGALVLNDIYAYGSMHENYHADTGIPLAPTAEQSENGVFTGFVGWNLLIQNMLKGAIDDQWLMLKIRKVHEAQH